MNGRVGRQLGRTSLASAVVAAILLVAPSGASAATTIGETFAPPENCNAGFTNLQTGSPGAKYAAPAAGVITSWSFQAGAAPPQLKFKVARTASANSYTVLGESPPVTPTANILNTFPVQIPVQAGDVIGLYNVTQGDCLRNTTPEYVVSYVLADVIPGATAAFTPTPTQQLDVSANLETTPCKGQVPTMAGTPGADTLVGTSGPDVIIGLEGRDTIRGLGGKDLLCGGVGKDTLKGGKGKDQLFGQGGRDILRGGGARDVCKGGGGNDSGSGCEVEKSL